MDTELQASKTPTSPTELLAIQTQALTQLVEIQTQQKAQIEELRRQNERLIGLLAAQERSSPQRGPLIPRYNRFEFANPMMESASYTANWFTAWIPPHPASPGFSPIDAALPEHRRR
jgi:hypothetical protein